MVNGRRCSTRRSASGGRRSIAVPANVGPRTMDYAALFKQGIYDLARRHQGVRRHDRRRVLDRPRRRVRHVQPALDGRAGVLSPAQDAAHVELRRRHRLGLRRQHDRDRGADRAADAHGPRSSRPRRRPRRSACGRTTSRPRVDGAAAAAAGGPSSGTFRQVQRMGNPLINELLIGTGSKDRFSMDQPKNDAQFASFFLDPPLPRVVNALTGGVLAIPTPPRIDLLPLVPYAPPIAAPGTPAGPVADLLRLNTGVAPTPPAIGEPARCARRRPRRLPQRPSRVRRRHRHRAARGGRRRPGGALPGCSRSTAGSATA